MNDSSFLKVKGNINPWATDVHSTSAAASIIRFTEKSGHLRMRREEDVREISNRLQQESASLRLIHHLGEIADKRKQLDKINVEIQCRLMDKETRDLTHLDILEAKLERLNSLNSHLQRVLEGKQELIHRLQQPLVGDFLRLEASYHPQARELFPLVAGCLAELSANLDNMQWSSQFGLQDGKMAAVLDDITTSLAQLQSGLQTVMQVRRSVNDI